MPIQHFRAPPGIKAPPLSYAARVGDLLFVSGIPGFDANGQLPEHFEAQFGFVVRTIKRVLKDAGTDISHLVKVNVLLTRASDVAAMNTLYAEAFRTTALSGAHHLRGSGAAQSGDADRDRVCGFATGCVIDNPQAARRVQRRIERDPARSDDGSRPAIASFTVSLTKSAARRNAVSVSPRKVTARRITSCSRSTSNNCTSPHCTSVLILRMPP